MFQLHFGNSFIWEDYNYFETGAGILFGGAWDITNKFLLATYLNTNCSVGRHFSIFDTNENNTMQLMRDLSIHAVCGFCHFDLLVLHGTVYGTLMHYTSLVVVIRQANTNISATSHVYYGLLGTKSLQINAWCPTFDVYGMYVLKHFVETYIHSLTDQFFEVWKRGKELTTDFLVMI